jgi:hypothetical protein
MALSTEDAVHAVPVLQPKGHVGQAVLFGYGQVDDLVGEGEGLEDGPGAEDRTAQVEKYKKKEREAANRPCHRDGEPLEA